ncbi:carboxy methyl transferase for protein phosphatase 2A [Lecanora helva]
MAAPQIPNLKTLRNRTVIGRGKGRDNAELSGPASSEDKVSNDRIVQQTDQDASVSRKSAVDLGYLDDPFAKYFVSGEGQRRFPIINRGTYVRTKAIDNLVETFVNNEPTTKKQIISLGAGSDTRFFRLMSRTPDLTGIGYQRPNLVYHEIDFPENTIEKLRPIHCTSDLCRHIKPGMGMHNSSCSEDDSRPVDTLYSENYFVHPLDLRTLNPTTPAPISFEDIKKDLPTLIISECCLVYLAPDAADAVAQYFTKFFFPASTPLGLILYEPINPLDAFGKVMVSNLAARGIVLQTLRKYGSLEAQAARMKMYGFEETGGATVNTLWSKGVDEKEKERVAGLEMVDEVEEWELLAEHYCVSWGWRGHGIWQGWKDMAKEMEM